MTTKPTEQSTRPRALLHKKILDAADDRPEASLDALAAEVSGATPEIVERILSEYGDPAASPTDTDPTTTEDMSEKTAIPEPDDLTEPQRELLHAIYEQPNATQRDLAELLDISGSTVSRRAHSIEGFDWDERGAFAEAVFASGADSNEPEQTPPTAEEKTTTMSNGSDQSVREELELEETDSEQDVETVEETTTSDTLLTDPELIHKVMHACMQSNSITEEEELQLLKEFLE